MFAEKLICIFIKLKFSQNAGGLRFSFRPAAFHGLILKA